MISTYYQNCVAGNVFSTKTTPGLPTTFYIALSKSAPNKDGSGVTEPTGGGYKRISLAGLLSEPVDGVTTNSGAVVWDEATGEWGTVTHFAIFDSAAGGRLLLGGKLPKSRLIQDGMSVVFQIGALKFTLQDQSPTA